MEKLRERPEYLLIPAIITWLAVNLPPWQFFGGQSLALFTLKTGILLGPTFGKVQSQIFPLTYTLAWGSIFCALYLLRSRIQLDWIRSLILSFTFPFEFLGVFEEIWQNLWIVRGLSPPLSNEVWMVSWVIVGLSTLPYWRLTKKSILVLLGIALAFSLWALSGYHQLGETSSILVPALNWITKTLVAVFFALLMFDGTKSISIAASSKLNA